MDEKTLRHIYGKNYSSSGFKGMSEEDSRELSKYGFCTPTYFLFQMRIDGHPNPETEAFAYREKGAIEDLDDIEEYKEIHDFEELEEAEGTF